MTGQDKKIPPHFVRRDFKGIRVAPVCRSLAGVFESVTMSRVAHARNLRFPSVHPFRHRSAMTPSHLPVRSAQNGAHWAPAPPQGEAASLFEGGVTPRRDGGSGPNNPLPLPPPVALVCAVGRLVATGGGLLISKYKVFQRGASRSRLPPRSAMDGRHRRPSPLCIPPRGRSLTCRFGSWCPVGTAQDRPERKRRPALGKRHWRLTPPPHPLLRGGAPPPSHPP